jgi:hypothetical protein
MFIAHRINSLTQETSKQLFTEVDGIEFDVRSVEDKILVVHDPFEEGQEFSEFVTYLDPSKFYIVNVKCEGIEEHCISAMDSVGCHNFFLLDCSVSAIMRLGAKGEKRMACRFSEVESKETVLAMAKFVNWVWIDVFTKLPLTQTIAKEFQEHNLKLCLVSPELQKQQEKLEIYKKQLLRDNIVLDAICAKGYNLASWKNYLEFCKRSFSLSQPRKEATSESDS